MKGILNLYKPKGMSSSDAVVKVRRILGERAVGHMGTLDPLAEGVLLLGVGKATRLFDYFLKKDKEYEAVFSFGYETDTLDSEGKTVRTSPNIAKIEEINNALHQFKGELMQIPPIYSAKSVDGERAYKLARKGVEVELKAVKINIYDIELIDSNPPDFKFRIRCSAGTYIRSIARDLAYALNSCATMTSLKRTRCGKYNIEDAVDFSLLEQRKTDSIEGVEDALSGFEIVEIPPEYQKLLENGVAFSYNTPEIFTLYCSGELYGIAENRSGIIKIKTYLKD